MQDGPDYPYDAGSLPFLSWLVLAHASSFEFPFDISLSMIFHPWSVNREKSEQALDNFIETPKKFEHLMISE